MDMKTAKIIAALGTRKFTGRGAGSPYFFVNTGVAAPYVVLACGDGGGVSALAPQVSGVEPGAVVLPQDPDAFRAWLRAGAPALDVHCAAGGGSATYSDGGASMSFGVSVQGIASADADFAFVHGGLRGLRMAGNDGQASFIGTLTGGEMAQIAKFAGGEEVRHYLNGIFFDRGGFTVATNGHVLAAVAHGFTLPCADDDPDMIIPIASWRAAARLAGKGGDVRISAALRDGVWQVALVGDGWRVGAPGIEASYPNWRFVLDSVAGGDGMHVTVPVPEALQAAKAARSAKAGAVVVDWREGNYEVFKSGSGVVATAPAGATADADKIGFKPGYWRLGVEVAALVGESADSVSCTVSAPEKPAVFAHGAARAVVMPYMV